MFPICLKKFRVRVQEHSACILKEEVERIRAANEIMARIHCVRYPAACVAIMYTKIDGQWLLENFWHALGSPPTLATGKLYAVHDTILNI